MSPCDRSPQPGSTFPGIFHTRPLRWVTLLLTAAALIGSSIPAAAGPEQIPALAAFDSWWREYVDTPEDARQFLVKKGTALASNRRSAMIQLIETDPATALQLAFPEEFHASLPPSIGGLVEQHVRGLASLNVFPRREGPARRTVAMDDQIWTAFLYGRRLELGSRDELPIHGVALAGRIAVNGSPLERFPERDTLLESLRQSEGRKACPICGKPGTIPAAVGDILLWFDSEKDLLICEKALIEKEMRPAPVPATP